MSELYLNVYDINVNRLGIIDDVSDAENEYYVTKHGFLNVTVDATDEHIDWFLSSGDRILSFSDDTTRGYIIDFAQFTDASERRINLKASPLTSILGWRIVEGTQRYYGNVETVMKQFVTNNAINPSNPNRVLPNVVLAPDTGINITTDEVNTGGYLDDVLFDIANKFNLHFELKIDAENKLFVFDVTQGVNRSRIQDNVPPIVFSDTQDNINNQTFTHDKTAFRTTAYVAGERNESERTTITLNNEKQGFARREVFFDARDLQTTIDDDELSPEEYENILTQRGESRLSEYREVQSFDSEIDYFSQYQFQEDYFLNDVVTHYNSKIGIETHTRVIGFKRKIEADNIAFSLEFGASVPNLADHLKRTIKNVSSGGGGGGASVTSENIASALGYTPVKASDITWANVLSKPTTFTPSTHTHLWAEITDKPTSFTPTSHTHAWADITNKPSAFTPSSHSHPWSEITGKPTTFAPNAHNHAIAEVTGLQTALEGKSASGHTHAWNDITGKPSTFTPSTHSHAWSEITGKPASFTPSAHSHPWGEITGKPTSFTPSTHTHLWAEITDKPTSFTPTSHTHAWADITNKPSTFTPSSHSHTPTQVGLGNVDNVKQATKEEFDNHVSNKSNPHGVTKSQVGLGSVGNYGISTQAEAQDGTSNAKYMTPLRTKEAIDNLQAVKSVNGKTGTVSLTASDVGASPNSHSHSWTQITGKPTTFTPSAHNHAIADVTGLQTALDGKSASGHTHDRITVTDVRNMNGSTGQDYDPPPSALNDKSLSSHFSMAYPGNSWRSALSIKGWNGSTYAAWQIAGTAAQSVDEDLYFRSGIGEAWNAWRKLWHEGNDGSGSGLDADLLDGKHADEFASSTHTHAWSEITGKPTTFTPSTHTHTPSQVGLGSVDNLKQVNAISTGSTADPNTTQVPYILTNHANSPGGGVYWHIHTMFYSTLTGNRSQIAVTYNGSNARMMIRHIYGSTWTPWTELSNVDHSHTWAQITGKPTAISTAEANAGTATTARLITAQTLKSAIQTHASAMGGDNILDDNGTNKPYSFKINAQGKLVLVY